MSDQKREGKIGGAKKTLIDDNLKNDIDYGVRYTRWLLSFLGIWPYVIPESTRFQRYSSIFVIIVASFSMLAYEIPMLCYVTMRDIENPELIILLGPIIFQGSNVIRCFILVYRRLSIRSCLQHMQNDWENIASSCERDIMMRNIKTGHDLSVIFMILMYSGGMFYNAIMPIFAVKRTNELNETIRPLAFPGSDIFVDTQSSPIYEIVFFGNVVSTFFHFTVVTAACNLAATLVSHACGQIQIVVSKIENLIDADGDDNDQDNTKAIVDRIALIIRSHVRTIKFAWRIDEVLREMCFMEVIASTSVICFLEYYCITEWNNSDSVAITSYVLLLFSLSFNIFIYCQIGEVLKEQCQGVGTAAYKIEWYRLPSKSGLSLVMIITMSHFPPKLTAGGMMELSFKSFGNIMKTTFTYFNMLRKMTE